MQSLNLQEERYQTMTENDKICPLKDQNLTVVETKCKGPACAWYILSHERCAVYMLAIGNIANLRRSK